MSSSEKNPTPTTIPIPNKKAEDAIIINQTPGGTQFGQTPGGRFFFGTTPGGSKRYIYDTPTILRLRNSSRTPPKVFTPIPGVTLDATGKPLPESAEVPKIKATKPKEKKAHKKADKKQDSDSPFPFEMDEDVEEKDVKPKKKTPKSPEL